MDMDRFKVALESLLTANEIEAAAMLDVADAQSNVTFYERKLIAAQERHAEVERQADKAGEELNTLVNQYVAAPILMIEHGSE